MFIGLVTSWNGLSWAFLSLPDDSCQCVHWTYAFCHTMHLFTLPSWTWVRHIYHLVTQYFPGLCEIKNESWWDVTISVLFCLLASIFAYIQLDNQTYLCLCLWEWLMAEERGEGLLPGGLAGLLATVQWPLLLLSLTHITTSLTLNRPPIFRWPVAFGTVCAGAV